MHSSATSSPFRQNYLLMVALLLSSALSVGMWIVRAIYTREYTFFFLNFNLFLAWIPLACALVAWWLSLGKRRPTLLALLVLCGWLLFLPNSPYLTTDLKHLVWSNGAPLWFDTAMVFLFAWNGLIVGIVSLVIVHSLVETWFGALTGWIAVGAAMVASGFGIYLGRFLRWNSWDILQQPRGLAEDILVRVLNPFDHPRAMAVTLLFSSLLFVVYLTINLLSRTKWVAASESVGQ